MVTNALSIISFSCLSMKFSASLLLQVASLSIILNNKSSLPIICYLPSLECFVHIMYYMFNAGSTFLQITFSPTDIDTSNPCQSSVVGSSTLLRASTMLNPL